MSVIVLGVSVVGIGLLVGLAVIAVAAAVKTWHRGPRAARTLPPWMRRVAWAHFGGASGCFTLSSSAAQDFVSSHHDLMAATFSADGAVPALSEVFGGRIYGGLVLLVSAGLVGVAARLLLSGVRSTTRGLRGTLGR